MNLGGVETLYHPSTTSRSSSMPPERRRNRSSTTNSNGDMIEEADDERQHRVVVAEELFLPAPRSWFAEATTNIDDVDDAEESEDETVSVSSIDNVDSSQLIETDSSAADLVVPFVESQSHDASCDKRTTEIRDEDEEGTPNKAASLIIALSEIEIDPKYHQPRTSSSSPPGTVKSMGARPLPAPSWKEFSSQVLPAAARELLSSSLQRVYHTARLSYASSCWRYRQYSDLNQTTSALGYYKVNLPLMILPELPPFSSLPWLDRQLVQEWKTYRLSEPDKDDEDIEDDFQLSRTLVPTLLPRPKWEKSEQCSTCRRLFGPTRLRHHCRNCGQSFCHAHSSWEQPLPHLGYKIPERVCEACKLRLEDQCLAERVAWRLARCRDFGNNELSPYFEIGVETLEEAALRVTQAALTMARSIPLGAQATVAVETVDVLRKYGLNGIYTVMLRQEFLAAADLLRKALGINRTAWPLSVHELSAAIFYALAQHRALRGMNPEREQMIHAYRDELEGSTMAHQTSAAHETEHDQLESPDREEQLPFDPVCEPVSDETMESLIFFAPIALNFIYVEKPVDMQLLAAQQGWRLLYAYLEQDAKRTDRPASALFVHDELKIACIAVRGTSTIQDVVTDIRQVPVPFPDTEPGKADDDWTTVFRGKGVAACGMAGAAVTLYREHIDSLIFLAKRGYKIRLTGHSLGGAVATLLGVLVYRDLERECSNLFVESRNDESGSPLRVYSFGTPSCVDEQLAENVDTFVTTVVLHDDCVPRLTPSSCRGLLKHLLHIRETWVKDHLPDDIKAITDRARTVWAPKWRGSFTLSKSSSKFKKYCRKQLQFGKQQILLVKEKLVGEECGELNPCLSSKRALDTIDERSEEELAFNGTMPSLPRATPEEMPAIPSNVDDVNCVVSERTVPEPRMLVDYLGGEMENGVEGLVIDGDEFFDPTESLLEENDYSSETGDETEDSLFQSSVEECSDRKSVVVAESTPQVEEDAPGSVVVEETPLPRMFVPGKLVHVYSHRGVYRAAYVPRTFRELRRISMAGNMLSDHKTKSYYEALLEVHSVRQAREYPPRWTAFDEDNTCSCCASRFTWASTSDSEAQQARDKHNCRSCGTLVCDPCSKNRIPLPSIGVSVPVRVCDRCYHDMSGVATFPSPTESATHVVDGKPERRRERRSPVVDDLASRIQHSRLL